MQPLLAFLPGRTGSAGFELSNASSDVGVLEAEAFVLELPSGCG